GEAQASYLTQALGLTVQNFLSAATGICVLFAFLRGFIRVHTDGLGSLWVDMIRALLYVLLPLSLVLSLCLVGGGVLQNLKPAQTVPLLEPVAVDAAGNVIANAVVDRVTNTVTVSGVILEDAEMITEQFVPMGPAASQIAIKQLGTNGGGYTGVNSAHPLENPNAFTNWLEMLSILLLPAALCFAFGRNVKDRRQGYAIFCAMLLMLLVALGCIAASE
ncbi:MAG: potassium-transporting ATPase subunit KdpA, partial [Clostridia bacterium]